MNKKILTKKASISSSLALNIRKKYRIKKADNKISLQGSDLDDNPSLLKSWRNNLLHNDTFFNDGNYMNTGLWGAGIGGIIGALVNGARGKNILTGALTGAGIGAGIGAGGKYVSDKWIKPKMLEGWQKDVRSDAAALGKGYPIFKENGRDYDLIPPMPASEAIPPSLTQNSPLENISPTNSFPLSRTERVPDIIEAPISQDIVPVSPPATPTPTATPAPTSESLPIAGPTMPTDGSLPPLPRWPLPRLLDVPLPTTGPMTPTDGALPASTSEPLPTAGPMPDSNPVESPQPENATEVTPLDKLIDQAAAPYPDISGGADSGAPSSVKALAEAPITPKGITNTEEEIDSTTDRPLSAEEYQLFSKAEHDLLEEQELARSGKEPTEEQQAKYDRAELIYNRYYDRALPTPADESQRDAVLQQRNDSHRQREEELIQQLAWAQQMLENAPQNIEEYGPAMVQRYNSIRKIYEDTLKELFPQQYQ